MIDALEFISDKIGIIMGGIVAATFTEALKKTELSRLAPGKIKEMAAQYDEYKENPPTWKEIIKSQDVAQISMSIRAPNGYFKKSSKMA